MPASMSWAMPRASPSMRSSGARPTGRSPRSSSRISRGCRSSSRTKTTGCRSTSSSHRIRTNSSRSGGSTSGSGARRMSAPAFKIEKPYYPIVYVRGYAMRAAEREEAFNDTYYGFSATSVEKRQAPAPQYFEADVFEGQLIRFMKIRDYGYADSVNRGLEVFHSNPARSLWVARFYDQDVFRDTVRKIEDHA